MNGEATFVWDALALRTPTMLRVVDAISDRAMAWTPPNGSNSVAWLLWHIAEVEDNYARDKLLGLAKRYPFGTSVRAAATFPAKADLLAYFHEVRGLTRDRLEGQREFDRGVADEHFGTLTVRQVWSLIATSAAWHGGQIVLTARLARDGRDG